MLRFVYAFDFKHLSILILIKANWNMMTSIVFCTVRLGPVFNDKCCYFQIKTVIHVFMY